MRAARLIAAGAVIATTALASVAAAAPEQVTIAAQPSINRWLQPVTLLGTVDSRRADEIVTIEAKDCGQPAFRERVSARTRPGGAWTAEVSPLITTTFRAVWSGRTSPEITIRARPGVLLRQRSAGSFDVRVQGSGGSTAFWRKRILFQRFDRRLGSWTTVKQVVLTRSTDNTPFTANVKRGSLFRAVLPRSQARPCYLAGYSAVVRT